MIQVSNLPKISREKLERTGWKMQGATLYQMTPGSGTYVGRNKLFAGPQGPVTLHKKDGTKVTHSEFEAA